MRKRRDPDPGLDPYLWLMDPDEGGPKTCGSGSGSGSGSLKLVAGGPITCGSGSLTLVIGM